MKLKEIRDSLKSEYENILKFEQFSINKIDNNLEKALCLYNSKRQIAYIDKLNLSTYTIKPLTLLMRYGNNQDTAETEIYKLYNFLNKKVSTINGKRVRFILLYENPINLGTDDKGIIEYSLEIDAYIEREG